MIIRVYMAKCPIKNWTNAKHLDANNSDKPYRDIL